MHRWLANVTLQREIKYHRFGDAPMTSLDIYLFKFPTSHDIHKVYLNIVEVHICITSNRYTVTSILIHIFINSQSGKIKGILNRDNDQYIYISNQGRCETGVNQIRMGENTSLCVSATFKGHFEERCPLRDYNK